MSNGEETISRLRAVTRASRVASALSRRGMTVLFAQAAIPKVAVHVFADAREGAKLHVGVGVCMSGEDRCVRARRGRRSRSRGKASDFCAYSALDGVYGTIKLVPLQRRL